MADPTIIDAGTRIDGRISGDADVTVIGRVDGEIALSETLTVADGGLVRGTINVREAVVEGAIDGDIVADERIFLTATARVVGTLTAPAIQMDDGAQFAGDVTMDLDAEVTPRAATRERTSRPAASTTTGSTTAPTGTPSRATGTATTGRPTTERAPARAPASTAAATAPAARSTTTTTTVEEPSEVEEAEPEPSGAEESDVTDMSAGQLQDLTVKELREELRERDMQVSGTKDELIERLQNAGD